MAEDLFRFAVIRPPDVSAATAAIQLDDPAPLFGTSDPRTLPAAAGSYLPAAVPMRATLERIRVALLALDAQSRQTPLDVVQTALGREQPINQLIDSDPWVDSRRHLSAAIASAKFRANVPSRPHLAELADLRRVMAAIELLGSTPAADYARVQTVLSAPLLLPRPGAGGGPAPPSAPPPPPEVSINPRIPELEDQVLAARTARTELLATPTSALQQNAPSDTGAVGSRGPNGYEGGLISAARWLRITPRIVRSAPTALLRADTTPRLSRAGVQQLSSATRATLTARGLDAEQTPLDVLDEMLLASEVAAMGELRSLYRAAGLNGGVASLPLRVGGGVLAGTRPAFSSVVAMAPLDPAAFLPAAGAAPPAPVPGAATGVRAAGVTDLLLVRQRLARYERTDISHVENVLTGETREREHRRRDTFEEVFAREVEIERTEEKDLQTAERYETQREASETVKEELEAKGEIKVTAKYGPYVEVQAGGSIASNTSRERSNQTAETFAKDTTQRTVQKVSERVREERRRRLVQEIEERNLHSFNNAAPNPPVIGVYQFLDKVYQAQVYNYGLRTLYDLVVPEPAAFYISAYQQANSPAQPRLGPPPPITITPRDLTESTYPDWVALYGAQDVKAPPSGYVTVGWSRSATREEGWEDGGETGHNGEVMIPEGYEAFHVTVGVTMSGLENAATVDVSVGANFFEFVWTVGNDTQTIAEPHGGTIPITIQTYSASAATVTVEIRCRRTAEGFAQWQVDTFSKLVSAYERDLLDYHAELDRVAAQAVAQVAGRNPALNRKLEAAEIKRAAVTILAGAPIGLDAINDDPFGVPVVDVAAARQQDPLIRFLEQAFEWENLTYLFYPYFWGREEPHWKQKILFEDVDPFFADFIKAGAARVILPVRPGFEIAVDHYCMTGEPWNGGDLPEVTDELYVPFVEEQRRQLGAPGDETPVGEPWEVRVPTNLVIVRSDGSLPRWHEVSGVWVEENPPPAVPSTGSGGSG